MRQWWDLGPYVCAEKFKLPKRLLLAVYKKKWWYSPDWYYPLTVDSEKRVHNIMGWAWYMSTGGDFSTAKRYTEEVKKGAVRLRLEEKWSYSQIKEGPGIKSNAQLVQWVRTYQSRKRSKIIRGGGQGSTLLVRKKKCISNRYHSSPTESPIQHEPWCPWRFQIKLHI